MGILKKVLYAVLITSLLMGGTIIAAVISGTVESDSISDDESYDFILNPGDAAIGTQTTSYLPRNTVIRQIDTDNWMYYPDFPSDAVPGNTVTLSAPIHGFLGWEADSNYADVDLSNQSSDEEYVYVTFTMPDEDVAVLALYSDNIPDDTSPPITPFSSFAPFDEIISPTSTDMQAQTLLSGMLGFDYSQRLPLLESGEFWLPQGAQSEMPSADGADHNWAFNDSTGTLSNPKETLVTPGTFRFILQYNTGPPENRIVDVPITLTIAEAITITTSELSNGMHEVSYEDSLLATVPLSASNAPWWWRLKTPGTLPDGLTLNPDGTVIGTPDLFVPALGNTYTFTAELYNPTGVYAPNVIIEKQITLYIWPKPEIQPRDDGAFLDGMVGQRYFDALTGVANRNRFGLLRAPAPSEFGADKYWVWEVNWVRNGEDVSAPEIMLVYDASDATGARLESPSGAAPKADEHGDYTVEIKIKPRIPNTNVATVSQTYSLKIWERPEFIEDPLRGFRLVDGMDSLHQYDDEPDDEDYVDFISVWYPENMAFNWTWSDPLAGTLPPGLSMTGTARDGRVITGLPCDESLDPKPLLPSKDYTFEMKITANVSDNPNIHEAEVKQNYNLMLWARRYLHLENQNPHGFVVRGGVREGVYTREEDVENVGWDTVPNWDESDRAIPYISRRAVMPGTDGIARAALGVSGFIRWEVIGANNSSVGFVNIGGQTTGLAKCPTGYWTKDLHGYTKITMPSRNSLGGFVDRDVYIRGVNARSDPATRLPEIVGTFDTGRVGRIYPGVISIAFDDIGLGSGPLRWSVEAGDEINKALNSPLPGLILDAEAGRITSFLQSSTPEKEGTFRFTIGVTLPGTMRIEKEFSILILSFIFGDVNGDGYVNLEDLVILARYLEGERNFERFDMKAADLNGNGVIDSGDLRILTMFFARPLATLPSDILASIADLS